MKNWLKNQDGYGQPVTLKLQGKEAYKSTFGGFVTTIGRMIILAYVVYKLIELANHKSNFNKLTWQNDVVLQPTIIPIENNNFKVAVVQHLALDEDFDFDRYFQF